MEKTTTKRTTDKHDKTGGRIGLQPNIRKSLFFQRIPTLSHTHLPTKKSRSTVDGEDEEPESNLSQHEVMRTRDIGSMAVKRYDAADGHFGPYR